MTLRPRVRFTPWVMAVAALGAVPMPSHAQEASGHVTIRQRGAAFLGIRLDVFAVPTGAPGAHDGRRLVVTDLYRGGPAERGGLQTGDIVVGVNGTEASFPLFQSVAGRLLPGDPMALTVLRGRDTLQVAVRAAEGPGRSDLIPLADAGIQGRLDEVRSEFVARLEALQNREPQGYHELAVLRTVPDVRLSRTPSDSVATVVMVSRSDGSVVRLDQSSARAAGTLFRLEATRNGDSVASAPARSRTRIVLTQQKTGRTEVVEVSPESVEWRPLGPYFAGENRVAGARLHAVDGAVLGIFGADRGLLVVEIAEGSPAAVAGLLPGDVVRKVGDFEVSSVGQFRVLLSRLRAASSVLDVVRRGRPLEVILPR